MSKVLATEISSYGNILINSPERLGTFKETLENWQEKIGVNMKIRIRGIYANEAVEYCKKYGNIHAEQGSKYIQWRIQAYYDVRTIDSRYLIIFLEDHQIVSSIDYFVQIVRSLIINDVDIFQYSWFAHYEKSRDAIRQAGKQHDSGILTLRIDSKKLKKLGELSGTYIVSLTSIFKKEFLLNLLETRKPYLRKYDSRGPFDIEKAPKSDFYLPIMYALPNLEFALCVDDDMGILGSSGISRGVSNLPRTKRGITHYSKLSPKFWISKIRTVNPNFAINEQNLPKSSIESVLRGILNIVNILTNTLEFVVFEIIDSIRKGLKN